MCTQLETKASSRLIQLLAIEVHPRAPSSQGDNPELCFFWFARWWRSSRWWGSRPRPWSSDAASRWRRHSVRVVYKWRIWRTKKTVEEKKMDSLSDVCHVSSDVVKSESANRHILRNTYIENSHSPHACRLWHSRFIFCFHPLCWGSSLWCTPFGP